MFKSKFLDIPHLSEAEGNIILPGSKSISNRVLLLAALCKEETIIYNLLEAEDTAVMLEALKNLGVKIEELENGTLKAQGKIKASEQKTQKIFLGNAGTAMRPLTTTLAILGGNYELSGVKRMHERPIGDLVEALKEIGCQIDYLENQGFPPLKIKNPKFKNLDKIKIKGNVSSQFLTSLLLSLPLISQNQELEIQVEGELISKPYVEITLKLLEKFGIKIENQNWQKFIIPKNSFYKSPKEFFVEADASSASYFIALGSIAGNESKNKKIKILGLDENSIQGDIKFIEAVKKMGAKITSGQNYLEIEKSELFGIDLDCNNIPDAAMTLAIMALYVKGETILRNIASWRVKETDRLSAMACELKKLGAKVEEGKDFLKIFPIEKNSWQSANIKTYDDHRMAMCFSLTCFNPAGKNVRIENPKCVAKTFPAYFENFFSLVKSSKQIPVICIDGPTASGKGSLAKLVAQNLGFNYLDSGSLYRILSYLTILNKLEINDKNSQKIADLINEKNIEKIQFINNEIYFESKKNEKKQNITNEIRTEEISKLTSIISAFPEVRKNLLNWQKKFRKLPGLVADGRDMSTVIFPDSELKIYLDADIKIRAGRRFKQLLNLGIKADLNNILIELKERDNRDKNRKNAPLKVAYNSIILDNSNCEIEDLLNQVLNIWQSKFFN